MTSKLNVSRSYAQRKGNGKLDVNPVVGMQGQLHTIPFTQLPECWTWESFANNCLDNQLGAPGSCALLMLEGIGPESEGANALLQGLHLAYVGVGTEWIVIPLHSTNDWIKVTGVYPDFHEKLDKIKKMIIERTEKIGNPIFVRTSFTPSGTPVKWANGYAIDLERTVNSRGMELDEGPKKGTVLATPLNLSRVLEGDSDLEGIIRYDAMAKNVTINARLPWEDDDGHIIPRNWEDSNTTDLQRYLEEIWELKVTEGMIASQLGTLKNKAKFNHVKDWLSHLIWDGKKRIGAYKESPEQSSNGGNPVSWLTKYCGAADTHYVRMVGRYWLLSAVARAFEPGCQCDHIMILEGPEGVKKGSLLDSLCSGIPGRSVVGHTPITIGNKDTAINLDGMWMYELAEFDYMVKKSDPSALKAFVTDRAPIIRRPYDRSGSRIELSNVWMGSTNYGWDGRPYLPDEENRRWWPVPITRIDLDAFERDRNQIWAEAVYLYYEGKALRDKSRTNPIWARFWTEPLESGNPEYDDRQIWEAEVRKRKRGVNVIAVELVRERLLGQGGYFLEDVKQSWNSEPDKPIENPYQCLTTSEIKRRLPELQNSELKGVLRALGFEPSEGLIRQNSKTPFDRHWYFKGKKGESDRRAIISTALLLQEMVYRENDIPIDEGWVSQIMQVALDPDLESRDLLNALKQAMKNADCKSFYDTVLKLKNVLRFTIDTVEGSMIPLFIHTGLKLNNSSPST